MATGEESSLRRSKRGAPEIAPAAAGNPNPAEKVTKIKRAKKRAADPAESEEEPAEIEPPEEEPAEIEPLEEDDEEEEEGEAHLLERAGGSSPLKRRGAAKRRVPNADVDECCFIGEPIPAEEARSRWPNRYNVNSSSRVAIGLDDDVKAKKHFTQAKVDEHIYELNDSAYVKAAEGEPNYIARIVEIFEGIDGQMYFSARWFFRAEDTAIKDVNSHLHDSKKVFLSEECDDNPLDCLVSNLNIVHIDSSDKEVNIPSCDFFYNMSYSVTYTSFCNIPDEADHRKLPMPSSSLSSEASKTELDVELSTSGQKKQLSLLDLYAGCGAMSTGLCFGANLSGVNLQTRWAVDYNRHACDSLRFNHPETQVRHELAEDFLEVLRRWKELCFKYGCIDENGFGKDVPEVVSSDDDDDEESSLYPGEFEVEKILDMCYEKTSDHNKGELKFKIHWKGYESEEDSWEPYKKLGSCEERIADFVRRGFKNNILPLPGMVDVVCGGPPCQGISGFNRFRNVEKPLDDEKNQQMVVYMDIIKFLKPRFVLMENVVDLLKFANGYLGRYALSQLISMNYQARMGIMAAGSYGLAQFRMRVFLWGGLPTEKLPQFPLPTHNVVTRGCAPTEFEKCIVAYEVNQHRELKKALVLSDAISDLPPVTNDEERDEIDYVEPPRTEFQKYIRLSQHELMSVSGVKKPSKLFDHKPLMLNRDDYERVCKIPKKKGANFRNLQGLEVGPDNKVRRVSEVLLSSGKLLVPDYAISFTKGKSLKPFGRLWWDETIPTVVTRAEPHNQIILHPEQDRVLTIRENARLQGFPDYYRFFGPVKERYMQVGNAVAVPVSRALGYSLGQAVQGKGDNNKHDFVLPLDFPNIV